MTRHLPAAALLLAGLTACTTIDAPPPPSKAQFSEWVQDRYAAPFKAGDTAKWGEVFADNAVALHNRRNADVGKPAIEAFGKMVAQIFKVTELDVKISEVRVNGTWALTYGTYTNNFAFKKDGKPAPWGREHGKFLFLWEHQLDGQWKIIADMGNSGEQPK